MPQPIVDLVDHVRRDLAEISRAVCREEMGSISADLGTLSGNVSQLHEEIWDDVEVEIKESLMEKYGHGSRQWRENTLKYWAQATPPRCTASSPPRDVIIWYAIVSCAGAQAPPSPWPPTPHNLHDWFRARLLHTVTALGSCSFMRWRRTARASFFAWQLNAADYGLWQQLTDPLYVVVLFLRCLPDRKQRLDGRGTRSSSDRAASFAG